MTVSAKKRAGGETGPETTNDNKECSAEILAGVHSQGNRKNLDQPAAWKGCAVSKSAVAAELGRLQRDSALLGHVARNGARVAEAQAALLRLALRDGTTTTDRVRAELGISGGNPRWLGAVPHGLRRAGLIEKAGYAECTRPEAHGRPVGVWRVRDEAAAWAWLRRHAAAEPAPAGGAAPRQPSLFQEGV